MIPKNIVLESERIRLEPLDLWHAPDLFEAGNDDAVWRPSHRSNQMRTISQTEKYITDARNGVDIAGIPFAIIDKDREKAIGSTRYSDISEKDARLEIGWTWLAQQYWRTHVNTTCKLLLLGYAFEQAGIHRVQLKADSENSRSRTAMERLGATYEGTLRDFRVVEGSTRSVSYYSILRNEWPAIKATLLARSQS